MTMKHPTKVLSFGIAMCAIAGLMIAFTNQDAFARPDPGSPVGDHVMTIHLKGVPNGTDRNCNGGNNSNIYTMFDTHKGDIQVDHQHIMWNVTENGNAVTDHCTENVGDDNDPAQVELSDGTYVITVRILGPQKDTNEITYCSQDQLTHLNDTEHCILDTTVVRDHGKPSFTVPKDIFSNQTEGEVWSLVTGSDFRNAQLDIWEAPQ